MEEVGSNQSQAPPQIIDKPASVTVFGILNIVFGVLGLMCSPFVILGLVAAGEKTEMASAYKTFLLFMNVAGFGFSALLLVLGIGLLMMKKWARRGSVIYACLAILISIIEMVTNVFALQLNWITIPEGGLPGYLGGVCGGLCGGLIYPILLLIFMQTAKVKRAFHAREEILHLR
jgi:hypothetical protein